MAAVVEGVGKTGFNQADDQLQQRWLAIILLHKLQHKLNTSANKTVPFTSLTSATQAGELKVAASTENDFPGFKNTTNSTVRVSLTATGQWCLYNVPTTDPELVIFNSQSDWKGLVNVNIPNFQKYDWRSFVHRPGSLLAELKDPKGSFLLRMCAPRYIELAPGCSAEFFINEDPRWCGDNSGEITLSYICTPAASIPPPLMKDHEGTPPLRSPSGSVVYPKKVISYAGIDFYPLLWERPNGRVQYLPGYRDSRGIKSFGLLSSSELIKECSIEPESEMLSFTTDRGEVMRLPWSSLVDTIPTPYPHMVCGRPSSKSRIPWRIAVPPQ